jgi:hypothetical protein
VLHMVRLRQCFDRDVPDRCKCSKRFELLLSSASVSGTSSCLCLIAELARCNQAVHRVGEVLPCSAHMTAPRFLTNVVGLISAGALHESF